MGSCVQEVRAAAASARMMRQQWRLPYTTKQVLRENTIKNRSVSVFCFREDNLRECFHRFRSNIYRLHRYRFLHTLAHACLRVFKEDVTMSTSVIVAVECSPLFTAFHLGSIVYIKVLLFIKSFD